MLTPSASRTFLILASSDTGVVVVLVLVVGFVEAMEVVVADADDCPEIGAGAVERGIVGIALCPDTAIVEVVGEIFAVVVELEVD